MNLLLTGDLHLRKTNPRFRRDDYLYSLTKKLKQIVIIANKYNAVLLIAGDIFDSPNVGYRVLNTVVSTFRKLNNKIYAVPGQHDMLNHRQDMSETPYRSLELALKGKFIDITGKSEVIAKNVQVYGASFGLEPNKNPSTKGFNILLAHIPVTKGEPPFFLTDALSAKQALRLYKNYQCIVTGDYHIPHITKLKSKRVLVNVGTIARNTVSQLEYNPHVTLLNTTTLNIKKIKLKVQPAEDVFNLDAALEQKEKGLTLDITGMSTLIKQGIGNEIDFEKIALSMAKSDNNINIKLLKQVLQEAKS